MTDEDIYREITLVAEDFYDFLTKRHCLNVMELVCRPRKTVENALRVFVEENITNPKYRASVLGAFWEIRELFLGKYKDMNKEEFASELLGIKIDSVM